MANLNLPRKHSEASTVLSSCCVFMYGFHQHDNKIESTRGHTGYILCDHTNGRWHIDVIGKQGQIQATLRALGAKPG